MNTELIWERIIDLSLLLFKLSEKNYNLYWIIFRHVNVRKLKLKNWTYYLITQKPSVLEL